MMTIKHKAAQSFWSPDEPSDRESARYPKHNLTHKEDGRDVVDCVAPLILPAQVPARGAGSRELFCVSCARLVDADNAQLQQAKEAAAAEGFKAASISEEAPVLPGTLPPLVRSGLFWAFRLLRMSPSDRGYDDAKSAVAKADSAMRAEDLWTGEGLTAKGLAMAALVSDPAVNMAALERTSDPSLAPRRKEKRRSRKAWIFAIVPRCAGTACYQPLPVGGVCACGKTETDPVRLAEVARCWAIVNEKAPEKTKRKAKQGTAEAT